MPTKESLVSLIQRVVEKVIQASAPQADMAEVKQRVAEIIDEDSEIRAKIESLPGKPDRWEPGFWQRNTRPFITLSLTALFIVIVVGPFLTYCTECGDKVKDYLDTFRPAFLALYGPIIGFWFGEKTALKFPGRPEPPVPRKTLRKEE